MSVLERVPLAEINARAATIDPVKALLSILAAPLVALGLVAALVWTALAWSSAAVMVGWEHGRQLPVSAGRLAERPRVGVP